VLCASGKAAHQSSYDVPAAFKLQAKCARAAAERDARTALHCTALTARETGRGSEGRREVLLMTMRSVWLHTAVSGIGCKQPTRAMRAHKRIKQLAAHSCELQHATCSAASGAGSPHDVPGYVPGARAARGEHGASSCLGPTLLLRRFVPTVASGSRWPAAMSSGQ
jgi:hypothetical protein